MSKRKVVVTEDFYILARALYEAGLRQKGESFHYSHLGERLAADIEAHRPNDLDESQAAELFIEGLGMGLELPEYRIELSTARAESWLEAASAARGESGTIVRR